MIVENFHKLSALGWVHSLDFYTVRPYNIFSFDEFRALPERQCHMKRIFVRLIAFVMTVMLLPKVPVNAVVWTNPYSDLSSGRWSYGAIATLGKAGILPDGSVLGCTQQETRGNFVSYLYKMHLALGGSPVRAGTAPFTDVPKTDPNYNAVYWAWSKGVVQGQTSALFAPSATIKRQDLCVMMTRFALVCGISLPKKAEAQQFFDSLKISHYARSGVTACQMAGLINGYENGRFLPHGQITREECLAVVSRFYQAATGAPAGAALVQLEPGSYDALYQSYTSFSPTLTKGAEAELSYFDDVVFVGDSVSVMLQYYCASTKALGNAKFLCAGSLSATNALWAVSDQSVHPTYQGKKMLVEDGVAASGAKKVYIMLGINNIGYGVSRAKEDMVKLIDRILQKTPGCQIYIQSVTPMAETSTIVTQMLNNEKIKEYNNAMLTVCEEKGWYFVNVAEVFRDENGYLPSSDCSDNYSMGIHFTNAAAEKWVTYLKTHTK